MARNSQLVEQLFREFVDGFSESFAGQTDAAKNCSAALYDSLFLLFGVTPENKALEMLSVTKHFKRQGLVGSAQTHREIIWLFDNYYKSRADCAEAKRHLEELQKEQLPKHEIRRFFSDAHPITEVLGDFSNGSRMQRSAPAYLHSEGPFKLLLDAVQASAPEPQEMPVQRLGAGQSGWEV